MRSAAVAWPKAALPCAAAAIAIDAVRIFIRKTPLAGLGATLRAAGSSPYR
jgi:hypothetical protein